MDIALDPLEGTTLTARDMPNALAVVAMAPRGTLLHAPDVYMEKLAVGPGFKRGVVTLSMSPVRAGLGAGLRQGRLHPRHHRLHPRPRPRTRR